MARNEFSKLGDDVRSLERERQDITSILISGHESVSEAERKKLKARSDKIGVAIDKLLKKMVEVDRKDRKG